MHLDPQHGKWYVIKNATDLADHAVLVDEISYGMFDSLLPPLPAFTVDETGWI